MLIFIWAITYLGFILDLTSRVPQGVYVEYLSRVSPLWQQKECARTDIVFFPISEVSESTVSLNVLYIVSSKELVTLMAWKLCPSAPQGSGTRSGEQCLANWIKW